LADMDRTNNPYEVGLDWLVDLDQRDDFIGKEALREIHLQGPTKKLIGAEIQGKPITVFNDEHWPVLIDNKKVGSMHALVYSPRLKKNIGYIIVDVAYARSGSEIIISSPEQELTATVVDIPWFERT